MPYFEPLPIVQICHPETGEPMTINENEYRPADHVLWVEPALKSKRKKVEEVVSLVEEVTELTSPVADE